jgi:8-oxo-dGTP pyrophosphatase MutT (NUDIX family)
MDENSQEVMFRSFVESLKGRLAKELPGEEAQFSMAPFSRERITEVPKEKYFPKMSAVLILLFPCNNSIHTVLIQRPEYSGVHSGQVAFPGGKFEEDDKELSRTALREASEEVGVNPKVVEIIGCLTDIYITPSNFLVRPFIAYSYELPSFIADVHEVQKIIQVDLFSLNDEKIKSVKSILHSNGVKAKTPYYEIEGLTIWGATAMMISELNVVVEQSTFS